jgi:hypothetical protein
MPNTDKNGPVREEDLVRDIDGSIIGYRGPSFRLVFKNGYDVNDEAWALARRGYFVGPKVQIGNEKSLIVHGDIDQDTRTLYEKFGVNVSQTKERGVQVPCRWT